MPENQEQLTLKSLLPILVTTALAGAALAIVVFSLFIKTNASAGAGFVTFDVIKFTNAQRAVASAFLSQESQDKAESAILLKDVSKKTRDALETVAKGRIILVRQGVIGDSAPDITDEVLKSLGLPTDVATSTADQKIIDELPQYLSIAPDLIKKREDTRNNDKTDPARILIP